MGKRPAEQVVLDLADEGCARPEARQADNGVGGRAAGHLDRRAHGLIDRLGAGGVDQRHPALAHALPEQEILFGAGNDIDDRIADAEHVVTRHCHE